MVKREPVPPLEGLLAVLVHPDGGRSASGDDVEVDLVQVMLGLGLAAGHDVDDVQVVGQESVVDVDDCALAALALPGADLELVPVGDVEGLVDHHPFALQPVLVGVGDAEVLELSGWRLRHLHVGALHNHKGASNARWREPIATRAEAQMPPSRRRKEAV